MNIFIGCSSALEIEDKYKEITKEIVEKVAKISNIHLVLGTAHDESGLMGICYHEFQKQNKDIIGVTLNKYQDLKPLKMKEILLTETTMDRSKLIYQKSDIFLFLPGGIGTYSEMLSFMNEMLETEEEKLIIVYNKDFFYTPIIKELYYLYKKGFISKNINEYCKIESDMDNILEFIRKEGEF